MELTGRLTADAQIKKLQDGRELVAFTLVTSDYYKTKEGENKKVATFYQCSYWRSTAITEHLTKGSILTIHGRIGIHSYKDMNGDAKAFLTFHTNGIKIISKRMQSRSTMALAPTTKDDLPF